MFIKKIVALTLIIFIALLASSCAKKDLETYIFDTFNTVISIKSHEDEKIFNEATKEAHDMLIYYNKLFDIYNEYSGINNLATLNKEAKNRKIKVDKELYEFLNYAKNLQIKYPSPVNIAMGNVLNLWHQYRENAIENNVYEVPNMLELQKAAQHTDINSLKLYDDCYVMYDEDITIDVGAIAKGYAVDKVYEFLKTKMDNFIINAGGNVKVYGKPIGRETYTVGIADPFGTNAGNKIYLKVKMKDAALVTSGDYQRYYEVDGVRYSHIIDPNTLYPPRYYKSVSIISQDSAIADYLSTALFCLDIENGKALLNKVQNASAIWIFEDGHYEYSDELKGIIDR